MEKAKLDFTNFLKNNAWGLLVAAAVIISNFTLLGAKTDEQAKAISDHENRIRTIELRQEMMMERLNNINEDTKFLREQYEKRGDK